MSLESLKASVNDEVVSAEIDALIREAL